MAKRVLNNIGNAFRESGQALDRVGLRALNKPIFREPFSRHRPVMNLFDRHPSLQADVFVAPNATVIGDVTIFTKSSVWYGAVVRGDLNAVKIGHRTSIGDRAVVNTAPSVEGHTAATTTIGNDVTIGSGALLTSCSVGNHVVIGAGAIIGEGAIVEDHAVVEPGAVVHSGRRVPGGQVFGGNPAVFIRNCTKTEIGAAEEYAAQLADSASDHRVEFLPFTTAYWQAEERGLPIRPQTHSTEEKPRPSPQH